MLIGFDWFPRPPSGSPYLLGGCVLLSQDENGRHYDAARALHPQRLSQKCGRFYLDGTVGPLTTPESTGNGGGKGHKGGKGGKGWKKKAGGSYHEIHIEHAINDRFTTVKYWPKNDFMGDVGLKEGDRVQLTTLVTGSNDFRWPVIDQLILLAGPHDKRTECADGH